MTVTSVTATSASASASAAADRQKTGLAALGQGDFLKLMTAQMQQQDPFNPVDQKEMLAQMAQFTQLSGITEMSATLKTIAAKLDAVVAAQSAATTIANTPATPA
jgi:flagellar basal-body rod modification protein FlgD